MIGSKLLHYEVTGKLGEGGMGEVYRARDTRLNRDVAIKVLPEAFTQDPERLARFEREAQVLASLNHPGIAAIYGLEEFEGQRFLVLELVEGATLAEHMAAGAMDVDAALGIADQMAVGMAAAHDAGIVHRDLKPANIKIAPDGKVKILDFGLAKAWETPGGDTGLTQSPTLTAQMTQAGVILGTAGYMSPEQARGQEADKRADVWSFGVILFEMLTGRRAFDGQTVSDVLASVLKETPDLAALPEEVPPSTRWVLERCLEREAGERLRDLGDVRLMIASGPSPTLPPTVGASGTSSGFGWGVLAAAVAAAVILGYLVASLGARSTAPAGASRPVRQVAITTPPLSFRSWGSSVALSPDGEALVYETREGLYLHRLASLEPRALPIAQSAREPFFSTDNQWLGFKNDGDSTLEKVFLRGGSPSRLFGSIGVANQGAWAADGTIYYGGIAAGENGLHAVAAEGGERRLVVRVEDSTGTFSHVEILPSGRYVLGSCDVAARSGRRRPGGNVCAYSLSGGDRKVLVEGSSQARYSATGHLVVVTEPGEISAMTFDAETLEITGPARRLVSGIRISHNGLNTNYSISQTGTLAYVPAGESGEDSEFFWLDRECGLEPVLDEAYNFSAPRLSPDDRFVLTAGYDGGGLDIWLLDVGRRSASRLFNSPVGGSTSSPVWWPDSESFIYKEDRQDRESKIKRVDLSGAQEEILVDLMEGGLGATGPADVLPDGSGIVFVDRTPAGDLDLFGTRGEGGVLATGVADSYEIGGRVSPDGKWLAFSSSRSGEMEIHVKAIAEAPDRSIQISTGGGRSPVWSRDGRELFFLVDGLLYVVRVEESRGRLEFSSPNPFCPEVRTQGAVDITADGQRLILRPAANSEATTEIRIIENWPALLEAGGS